MDINDPMSLDEQETPQPMHKEKQVSEDFKDELFQTPHTLRRKYLKRKIVEMFEGDTEAEESSGGEEERYEKREAR